MKVTSYFYTVLLFSSVIHHACTMQRVNDPVAYTKDSTSSNVIVDKNVVSKRDAPSLSIVNPLDVLRKRLLLEMARRQMKENTRQVERNRAILKNVGKRINQKSASTLENVMMPMIADLLPYTRQQLLHKGIHMYPNVHILPRTSILDYVENPSADIIANFVDTNNKRRENKQAMNGDRSDYEIGEEERQMSINNIASNNEYRNHNDDYRDDISISELTNRQSAESAESAENYEFATTLLRRKRSPDNIQLQTKQN